MATHIRDYDFPPGRPDDGPRSGSTPSTPGDGPLIELDLSALEDPDPGGTDEPVDAGADGPGDYPILTEVVDSVTESEPAPRHLALDELEHELRAELINQVSQDLEQRIESRIYGRLSNSIDEIASRVRNELFTEVRRVIREVVAEVLDEEKQRVRAPSGEGGGQS